MQTTQHRRLAQSITPECVRLVLKCQGLCSSERESATARSPRAREMSDVTRKHVARMTSPPLFYHTCPRLICGITPNTTSATPTVQACHIALSKWSRRLCLVFVVVGVQSLPEEWRSLLRDHHQARPASSRLLFFGLALWHHWWAPAQPPFCGLVCGKRGFQIEAVVGSLPCTLGNRPQTLIRLPPFPTQQHALLLALLLAATINHDHQRDSMLCSLATKAGAMAGRRGAVSGRGKVACAI
jgi:hypothetical protein